MDFDKNHTFLRANNLPFKVKIENGVLKPTLYKLLNINFFGIPQNTAFTGALIHKTNPKRIKELEIFKKNKITPRKKNYLNVYWGERKINWIYDLINFFLKVLGKIRVKLGLAYDPWR